jgi:hypothetical protein
MGNVLTVNATEIVVFAPVFTNKVVFYPQVGGWDNFFALVYTVHLGGDLQRDGFGAIFLSATFSRQTGFSLARFSSFLRCEISSLRCYLRLRCQLTKFDYVCCHSVLDLYNIPLVIFYSFLLCIISVSYAPLSIKPFAAPLSKETYSPLTLPKKLSY